MARSIPSSEILNGCVLEMSEPSGLSQAESLHLASRHWSDSFARSPYVSLMNAFSEFWLWKVNQSTRGSENRYSVLALIKHWRVALKPLRLLFMPCVACTYMPNASWRRRG